MLKKIVVIVVVLAALLATAGPALALQYGYSGTYYVDTAYTGTETGSPTQPFNTLDEAISAAQNNPYGGSIYTRVAGDGWSYYGYIASVVPPYTGSPLSGTALFALLGLASLILVAAGFFLLRRARALPSGA